MTNNIYNTVKENNHNPYHSNLGHQEQYSFIRDNMGSFTVNRADTIPEGINNREESFECSDKHSRQRYVNYSL